MIYLFRHGETNYNLEHRFLGATDLSLCHEGITLFEKIADKLRDKEIEVVYSSNLKRAVQSAEIIARNLNIPHYIRQGLEERDLGMLDGKKKSDSRYAAYIPELIDLSFVPPGARSAQYYLSQFSQAIQSIQKTVKGNVAVISHGGVIALYLKHAISELSNNIFLKNGAFHLLDSNPKGELFVKKLNQIF